MCQIHISLSEDNVIANATAPTLEPVGQFSFANYSVEGSESGSHAFSTTK